MVALGLAFWFSCCCASAGMGQQDLIVDIEVHGNRRIPAETIKARIFTHAGDVYDEAPSSAISTPCGIPDYFDDIRFEREQTPKGWIIHVYVKERPTIRDIDYVGLNSVSKSDVLDRFKEAKVGLSPGEPIRSHQGEEGRGRRSRDCLPSTAGSSPPSAPRFSPFRRRR